MAEREIWFEYWREGRRFKAAPVNWKGWLALLVVIAAGVVVIYAGMFWFMGANPFALTLCWSVGFAGVLGVIFTLLRRYGRPRKGSDVRLW